MLTLDNFPDFVSCWCRTTPSGGRQFLGKRWRRDRWPRPAVPQPCTCLERPATLGV